MRKQMTHKEFIALAKYLEAHKAQIHQERPSYAAVAQQAGMELGFECTDNNVRAAAVACDMVWTARRTTVVSRTTRQHVSRILAKAVLKIASELGIQLEPQVAEIARARRITDETDAGGETARA